jgi:DNA-binding response OmpR family regulator
MRARYKVLVADDDLDITDLVTAILQEDNHDVVTAHDGAQAVDLAVRESPDVIVLDVNMPKADGYEVIRQLRESDVTKRTPIILLTANNNEGAAAQGFAGGADDFLVKPFAPSHLRARVMTWLLRSSEQHRTK